jgi:hypothetical protein
MANPRVEPWTIHDLERFPYDEWHRYEIIDGELFVSKAPGDHHQYACTQALVLCNVWFDWILKQPVS